MSRKKKTKRLTVTELQSYIKGAVELNADDWHPDKEQWAQIVEMIQNVKPDSPTVTVAAAAAPVNQGRPPVADAAPSVMNDDDGEQLVTMPSGGRFDASANPANRPTVEKIGEAGEKNADGSFKSGIVVKTPNVPVTEGDKSEYKSGFE